MAAYLDELIAACDALEQRIVDAQQACGRALAALNAARIEMGLPVPTAPRAMLRDVEIPFEPAKVVFGPEP